MRGIERERALGRQYYLSENYFSLTQLWSFSEQIYHIIGMRPQRMIEIGVGNGFVSEFLRTTEIDLTTIDVNPNLAPDIIAPVQEIGEFIRPDEYDLISCCEVLEHLPFEDFEPTVKLFSTLSEQLFLTLPVFGNRRIGFGGVVQLPKLQRWLGVWLRLPILRRRLPEMHFWEVDYNSHTRKKSIVEILRRYYPDVTTGLFKANPYHRYFKCRSART